MTKKAISYKDSGVDIDVANVFVKAIKSDVRSTLNKNVLQRSGSFGALFGLETKKYKKPVLVSSTDGVGTKLLIAQQVQKHDTVGIDLVAMNVNDILCVGAKPLFFLDYIACGKLDVKVLKDVVKGIAKGCRESECALIGGETAEMPDMYKQDEYDLAGFAVGVVDEKKIVDGAGIKKGDCLLALPSSGIHSNGYSLVRKVLGPALLKEMAREVLKPTRIYVKETALLTEGFKIKGMAHITGGAWYEKLTKVLPKGLCFSVSRGQWRVPKIFHILQKKGRITDQEMYRTFNMGIGMVYVLSRKQATAAQKLLKQKKIKSYLIGEVIEHPCQKVIFED